MNYNVDEIENEKLASFSLVDFNKSFEDIVFTEMSVSKPNKNSKAVVLGGQPGSGKVLFLVKLYREILAKNLLQLMVMTIGRTIQTIESLTKNTEKIVSNLKVVFQIRWWGR